MVKPGAALEVTTEIRPGVFRPDWSAVTLPAAREALSGRMAARAGLLKAWSQILDSDDDRVWRVLLRHYACQGRPPAVDELARQTGVSQKRTRTLLRNLQSRDMIGLDADTEAIRYAYPFTQAATGHRVELNGQVLHALCAIDALGVGEMYSTDVLVESSCRVCGEKVHIATSRSGRALCRVAPADSLVWYDFAYAGSASASCCPAIAFFCSDEHLRSWLDTQTPRRDGVRLAMVEALELGRAIFGPVLKEPRLAGSAETLEGQVVQP